jgi:hypothetical protein
LGNSTRIDWRKIHHIASTVNQHGFPHAHLCNGPHLTRCSADKACKAYIDDPPPASYNQFASPKEITSALPEGKRRANASREKRHAMHRLTFRREPANL